MRPRYLNNFCIVQQGVTSFIVILVVVVIVLVSVVSLRFRCRHCKDVEGLDPKLQFHQSHRTYAGGSGAASVEERRERSTNFPGTAAHCFDWLVLQFVLRRVP
ncbi:UNVERIFIED_CONTAM: hypothetical protein K2H54_014867 [Gekko kuhli]